MDRRPGCYHVVDDEGTIPEGYRTSSKLHHATKPVNTSTNLLSPSRTYPTRSQGAFAQKLALDLGLIKSAREDALGPLGAVGIHLPEAGACLTR
jgi:hypothetical protein